MQHLYLDPVPVAIWTAVIVISFVFLVSRILVNLRQIRTYRRELASRAQALRIHQMLGRAGTTLSRYLRRTRSIDVEQHLLVCESCTSLELCDKYLSKGEAVDPRAFCPNFADLAAHARTPQHHEASSERTSSQPVGQSRQSSATKNDTMERHELTTLIDAVNEAGGQLSLQNGNPVLIANKPLPAALSEHLLSRRSEVIAYLERGNSAA